MCAPCPKMVCIQGPRLWRVKSHFRVRSRGSGFDGSGKIATSVSSCSIFVSVRDCGCRVAMGDLCSLAGRRPRAPSTGVGLLVDGNSMATSLVLHPRGASSEVSSTAGETGSVGRGRSGRMGLDSSVLSGRRIDAGRHGMREVSSSISAAAAGGPGPRSPSVPSPHPSPSRTTRRRPDSSARGAFLQANCASTFASDTISTGGNTPDIVARNESASPERAQVGSTDGASSGTTVCPMVSAVWLWASRGGERGAGQTNLQFTLFRIPSWSSRIYEYESTLPGAVSSRPPSGTGWRLNAALGHRSGPWMLAAFGRHERRQHLPARSVFGVQIDHLGADTQVR